MSPSAPWSTRWCSCLAIVAVLGASACSLLGSDDDASTLDVSDDECFGGWLAPQDLDIPVVGAVVQIDGSDGDYVALTSSGRVIQYHSSTSSLSEQIGDLGVTTGLRSYAIAGADTRFAVGDGGQIWRGSTQANDWQTLDAGISSDIHTVLAASDGAWVVVATDSQAFVSTDLGDTWTDLNRPVGLRRGFWVGDAFWFVGDNGQIWSATSPEAAWTEESSPTGADLIGGGAVPDCSECVVVFSSSAVFARDGDGEWTELSDGIDSAIVSYHLGRVATEEGQILDIGGPGGWSVSELAVVEFVPTVLGGDVEEIQIAGSGSEMLVMYYQDGC